MLAVYILLGLAVLLIFWAIAIYNKLVSKRQMVEEGWSGIDVQLKRRTDLIPNLLETVKGYMGHEKSVLEDVTAMRAKAQASQDKDIAERGQAEAQLSGALMNLFAVAENYPDLKASQNFQDLQNSLSQIESEIQLARRYYNGTVREMNILVESFPSNLIAKQFHFEKSTYFELDNEEERAVPKVDFQANNAA